MPQRNSRLRLAWLSLPLALGAGVLYWTLAPGGPARERGEMTRGTSPEGSAHKSPISEVARVVSGSRQGMIDTYGDWAGDPSAVQARKLVLSKLFAEDSLPQRLSGVLAAVQADGTRPEQDPIWPYLVDKLSNEWRGETLSRGLDLMFAESRERPKLALVSSFAALANSARASELTTPQTQTLTNYFVDMYRQLPAMQQAEVDAALRKVANNDVADILAGKTVTAGTELEGERAYKQSLAEAQRALAKGPEAFNPAASPHHGQPPSEAE